MKDSHTYGQKMARNGRTKVIYKGTFISIQTLDVLWGQPIKLIQVASNSELRENQWNDLLFFEIVPSHCFGASEVQT